MDTFDYRLDNWMKRERIKKLPEYLTCAQLADVSNVDTGTARVWILKLMLPAKVRRIPTGFTYIVKVEDWLTWERKKQKRRRSRRIIA